MNETGGKLVILSAAKNLLFRLSGFSFVEAWPAAAAKKQILRCAQNDKLNRLVLWVNTDRSPPGGSQVK
jgi:hypothetical protein